MATAYLEIRSQKAKGVWPRQGPDKYVAVQIVPDGVEPLVVLNQKIAKKRGIILLYCGEGYYNRKGPKSSFGRAVQKAKEIADAINN